jgi:hypothetical protein
MSDLVKRLREGNSRPTDFDDLGWTAATCGLVSEAADRLEALEAALRQARTALINSGSMETNISKNAIAAINDLLKD